ncbi:unnamed protein product, partial [Closterium sp. NIES-53]
EMQEMRTVVVRVHVQLGNDISLPPILSPLTFPHPLPPPHNHPHPLLTSPSRPRKEVWPLTSRLLQEMSELRTVVVGVHVRISDSVFGAAKGGVTNASMAAALENAAPILACARVR